MRRMDRGSAKVLRYHPMPPGVRPETAPPERLSRRAQSARPSWSCGRSRGCRERQTPARRDQVLPPAADDLRRHAVEPQDFAGALVVRRKRDSPADPHAVGKGPVHIVNHPQPEGQPRLPILLVHHEPPSGTGHTHCLRCTPNALPGVGQTDRLPVAFVNSLVLPRWVVAPVEPPCSAHSVRRVRRRERRKILGAPVMRQVEAALPGVVVAGCLRAGGDCPEKSASRCQTQSRCGNRQAAACGCDGANAWDPRSGRGRKRSSRPGAAFDYRALANCPGSGPATL